MSAGNGDKNARGGHSRSQHAAGRTKPSSAGQWYDRMIGPARVRLFQEDCLAGMGRRLPTGAVDVVVTSPPYNLGVPYSTYDDTTPRPEYLAWLGRWAEAVRRVLADNGSLFLVMGGKPSDRWPPHEALLTLRPHFQLQNEIVWVKSITIDRADLRGRPEPSRDLAVGHFQPIPGSRFLNDGHEFIFHLTKTGQVPLDRLAVGVEYQDPSNRTRWASGIHGRRCRGSVWCVPYPTLRCRAHERPHPAPFPPELVRKCLLLHGRDHLRLVLDPFLGMGNAAVAGVSLGVNFMGFEIAPDYFGRAVAQMQRLADTSPGPDPKGRAANSDGAGELLPRRADSGLP